MNPGQSQFFNFIMERVTDQDAAKALLESNFQKQADGTFTKDDLFATQEELMKILKPEAVEEVKSAMAHFASQMKQ